MGNESENDEKMKQLNIRLKEGEVSRVFAAIGMADGEVPDATAVCVFLRRQLGEVASEQALTNGGAAR